MLPQLSRNRTTAKSFIRRPGAESDDTTIPVPEGNQPPPLRRPTRIARSHTLSRPERGHPLTPLLNPDGEPNDPFADPTPKGPLRNWWRYLAMGATFWAPPSVLNACGKHNAAVRQAWREKFTLVLIATILCAIVAYITVGLQRSLCKSDQVFIPLKDARGMYAIGGEAYNGTHPIFPKGIWDLAKEESAVDLSPYIGHPADSVPACQGLSGAFAKADVCMPLPQHDGCIAEATDDLQKKLGLSTNHSMIGYEWQQVMDTMGGQNGKQLMAMDGWVLNMSPYLQINKKPIPGDFVDEAIRSHFQEANAQGPDATRRFVRRADTRKAMNCLKQKYTAGRINYLSSGCFVAEIILYISLIVILGIVIVRTAMAIWFHFIGSRRLMKPPPPVPGSKQNRRISHQVLPADAGSHDPSGVAPWASKQMPPPSRPGPVSTGASAGAPLSLPTAMTQREIGNDPYVICLVTCYSEGVDGISATLASLSKTEYPANRQLLFVVADGMVTGAGESISTPDICVSLMSPDPRFGTPMPMSYTSVGTGKKAHNMALVYAGHYIHPSGGEPVPMVVVAKCGTPAEANDKKPGNRGKRDSQMVLLHFLQRVTYDDPMSPLDYDLFRKVHALMGVTPDFFELILMVDADTLVYPPALRSLCNAMMTDSRIMGACGETRIENKSQSWVTMIQVFEYFISHHQIKAFESVFGGVTCLPGCFSIYRIKARKASDDDWVPVVVKPEVIREYSQSVVTTLHQKNLLLLGEDRFLSTMMLRTFPHRKMVFVPQAVCRTEVPHTFRMLLSQRRRWINSTVHNLMELVMVRDLCGTFCFSMQFVVLMDLIGTLVLPVAICLTYVLIILSATSGLRDFASAIPLIMLLAVLILPGVVVALATCKFPYLGWLVIYLIFLPVWNLILPAYSFWHFDDFSWGETRKVEGEAKGESHDVADEEGYEAMKSVPLRQWEDWERSRIRKQKRDERRRMDMQNQFGEGFYNDANVEPVQDTRLALAMPPPRIDRDDATSVSSDWNEDRWGDQVGGYNENETPPDLLPNARPVSVMQAHRMSSVFNENDLEDLLQSGWDENPNPLRPKTKGPFQSIPNHSIVSLNNEDPLSDSGNPRESIDVGSLPAPILEPSSDKVAASSAVGAGHSTHARNRSYGGLRFDTPYDAPKR